MKNQNASAEYPHIPAKGSLQTAMPMAALRSLPLLQWRQSMESPLCGWEEFFFSNCSVSSAGRRRGFPLHP